MVQLINSKQNIFNDNIAYVEQWDFSRANMSEENRINAITQVASICYQNPKALNSESLYNRLMAESIGLPSSSFEFVPVLFRVQDLVLSDKGRSIPSIFKFGEMIQIDDNDHAKDVLLTNYRALVYDVENGVLDKSYLNFFNTEEDCEIIKQHFKVFNYKVDLPTRSQMVRHRCSWQELSRRYVSGERVPFDFYVSEKMKDIQSEFLDTSWTISTDSLIGQCLSHYQSALKQGVKPQEARRIIPQAAYTQIWGAYLPTQYSNFMKLRDDEKHAQWEIAQVAKAMKELV